MTCLESRRVCRPPLGRLWPVRRLFDGETRVFAAVSIAAGKFPQICAWRAHIGLIAQILKYMSVMVIETSHTYDGPPPINFSCCSLRNRTQQRAKFKVRT